MSAILVRQLPIDPMKGTYYFSIDGDPAFLGFAAAVDSLCLRVDSSGLGRVYKKTGAPDTGWTEITGGSSSVSVATTTVQGISRVDDNAAGDPQALTATGHLLAADPHPQYALDTEKGAPSGIATLDGASLLTASQLPLGSSASTAAAGNDARLSDSRTPVAHAASHASGGSDPVTLAESQVTSLVTDLAAKEVTANKGAVSGYASLDGSTKVPIAQLPTGSSSATVAIGNDARLSDARTPLAHAASHAAAGTDALTLSESQVTNLTSDLASKQALGWPSQATDPGSVSLSGSVMLYQRFTLSGPERLTATGTARAVVSDFGTLSPVPMILGTPRTPNASFLVPDGYYLDLMSRLTLTGTLRASALGSAQLILTDDVNTRSRFVGVGRG